MSITLGNLKDYLRQELHDPNDKTFPEPAKTRYINSAVFQVSKDGLFRWGANLANDTQNSVSGTMEYDLPADFVIKDLLRFDGVELKMTNKNDLKRENTSLTGTGTPSEYYIYNDKIGLYPIPDSVKVIDLDYRKRIPDMADDSDTVLFSDNFIEAITKYAKYLAWSAPRGNKQFAMEALEDYREAMNTLKASYLLADSSVLTFSTQRK